MELAYFLGHLIYLAEKSDILQQQQCMITIFCWPARFSRLSCDTAL